MQILIFVFVEFFIFQYAGLVFCNLIQSMIRSVICSVFLYRFFISIGKPITAKRSFYIYLVVLLGFDIFLVFDIFLNQGIGVTCDGKEDW